jgi:tetratricopeptide (TPR) repeat protein
MLKQILISAVVFGIASMAQENGYKPYGNYDLRNSLIAQKSAGGNVEYRIDKKLISQVLDDLTAHAKDYPTKFRSKEERARAVRDAKKLQSVFDTLASKDDTDTQILFTAAILNGLAHNLDIEGAAQKAVIYYERILHREPENPKGNYYYGTFLASASRPKESLPYLEKALKLGVEQAGFSLGMAHLTMGDEAKALEYLESYSKRNPSNKEAKQLVENLKAGKIGFRVESPAKAEP